MKGDFSRFSHRASRHYAGVLMQQGRVTLDADWNEQFDIEDHRWRVQTVDTIGRACAPVDNDGFELTLTPDGTDLIIKPGRIYIDGVLVELDSEPEVAAENAGGDGWLVSEAAPGGRPFAVGEWVEITSPAGDPVVARVTAIGDNLVHAEAGAHAGSGAARIRRLTTYLTQPFFPAGFGSEPPADDFTPEDWPLQTHVAYLQVWRSHVTAVEDPHIREVALGGPDTATRVQTVWAVRLLHEDAGSCDGDLESWDELIAPSAGRMSAQAQAAPDPDDDCKVLPDAGYRGLSNRLYRVEIHEPGALGTATFKWSRDNGSVLSAIAGINGTTISVASLGRDEPTSFRADDQVEVLSDETELSLGHGQMAAIVGSPDTQQRYITLDADVSAFAAHTNPRLRRWDQPGAPIATGPGPIELEDGVEVSFSAGPFDVGDYWVIPARVATGDVEGFSSAPPRGIRKHYARIALVTWPANNEGGGVRDCRRKFAPLCGLFGRGVGCATVTVGDGVTSTGDFTDLQDAIDSLSSGDPATVSILPGDYVLPGTVLVERSHTTIRGCGRQTVLRTRDGDPAFLVQQAEHVRLDALTIHAGARHGAVVAAEVKAFTVAGCTIDNASAADPDDDVNPLGIPQRPAVVVSRGVVTTVAGNELRGAPSLSLQSVGLDVRVNTLAGGGVWVRDGSKGVRIAGNTIAEGHGPGVALGSLGPNEKPGSPTGVQHVQIVHNHITSMEGSGITSLVARRAERGHAATRTGALLRGPGAMRVDENTLHMHRTQPAEVMVSRFDRLPERISLARPIEEVDEIVVEGTKPTMPIGPLADITIAGNTITGCAQSAAHPAIEPEAVGGVVLRDAFLVRIHDNEILSNGKQGRACGVFLVGCDSVEASDNVVRDNGSKTAVLDLDFSSVEARDYETPMTVDSFKIEVEGGNGLLSVVDLSLMRALAFHRPLTIHLAEEVYRADLAIASDASVRVDAIGTNGNVVATVEGQPVQTNLRYRLRSQVPFQTLRVSPASDDSYLLCICVGAACLAQQAGIAIHEVTSRRRGVAAARVHDNVVAAPRGPALIVTGAGAMSVADNNLTSFGLALPAVRETEGLSSVLMALMLPKTVFIWNAGMNEILGALASRFSSGAKRRSFSISDGGAASSTGFLRSTVPARFPDGRTSFHGNQVAFNDASANSRLVSSAMVVSLDDVAINDNQMDIHAVAGAVFNTLAMSPTLRAGGNKWHEPAALRRDDQPAAPTLASYLGIGIIFSAATDNQAVHCIVPQGIDVVDDNNQEMIALFNPQLCPETKKREIGASVGGGSLMQPVFVEGATAPIEVERSDSLVMSAAAVSMADYRPLLTENMALHQTAMAARLAVAGARLEAELGSDDAEVIALLEESAMADELRVSLNVETEIEIRRPTVVKGQWLAHGTIQFSDGEPATGLKVRLLDPSRRRSDPVGEASTDEFGNWAITYSECPPVEKGKTGELTLAVHGARNKILFDSADSFTLGDAPVDFVELEFPRPAKRRRSS